MTWLKKDDRFPEHRKIRRLSDGAYRLHDTALCACAKDETDGLVTESDIADMQHGERLRKYVPALVLAGLWVPVANGWRIHDYLDYNPSHAQLDDKRAADRKRQEDRRHRLAEARSQRDTPGIVPGSQRDTPGIVPGSRGESEESVSDRSDNHTPDSDETTSHEDVSQRDSRVSHSGVTRESQHPDPTRPDPTRPDPNIGGQPNPNRYVANARFGDDSDSGASR